MGESGYERSLSDESLSLAVQHHNAVAAFEIAIEKVHHAWRATP